MFTGGVTPLTPVDATELIVWVDGISRRTWPGWSKPNDSPALVDDPAWERLEWHTQPVVSQLLTLFPGCRDAYRYISALHPGDYVPPHTDTLVQGWVTRVHVPIITNEDAVFIVDEKEHHLEVGMAYQVNPQNLHAVANRGNCTRIHLMFDVLQ